MPADVDTGTEEALDEVRPLFGDRLLAAQLAAVEAAKEAGATWDQIGGAMGGKSRTNAQNWWARNRRR